MNKNLTVGVILMITLGATVISLQLQIVYATRVGKAAETGRAMIGGKAPIASSGENVYIA